MAARHRPKQCGWAHCRLLISASQGRCRCSLVGCRRGCKTLQSITHCLLLDRRSSLRRGMAMAMAATTATQGRSRAGSSGGSTQGSVPRKQGAKRSALNETHGPEWPLPRKLRHGWELRQR